MLSENILTSNYATGAVFVLKMFQDKCNCDYFQFNCNRLHFDFVYSQS